jgi:hypothetical protein
MALDYEAAAGLLEELFAEAEAGHLAGTPPSVSASTQAAAAIVFASSTQAYREVLLGCGLATMLDRSINIRHPYANQGTDAFNGRTLDERVVNPFLQDRLIPCSKGPYLSVFRRSVTFTTSAAGGLRDKQGYNALLEYIGEMESADEATIRLLVVYLLYQFVLLRDKSVIPLARIGRLSLEQYGALVAGLLQIQSGGLVPVLLTVSMLQAVQKSFGLPWVIEWQGINVPDAASGAGGDVTVKNGDHVILAIEVTERPIAKSRVVSTFNTKIVQNGISDYMFIFSNTQPDSDARTAAKTYFTQGHEINFIPLQDLIVNNLALFGAATRAAFMQEVLDLFGRPQVPARVKVGWNDLVKKLVGA